MYVCVCVRVDVVCYSVATANPIRVCCLQSKDANTLAVGLHKGKVCLYSPKENKVSTCMF